MTTHFHKYIDDNGDEHHVGKVISKEANLQNIPRKTMSKPVIIVTQLDGNVGYSITRAHDDRSVGIVLRSIEELKSLHEQTGACLKSGPLLHQMFEQQFSEYDERLARLTEENRELKKQVEMLVARAD